VTSGNTPFRIEFSAPSHSLHIAADGNVGLGTTRPTATLDVSGNIALGPWTSLASTYHYIGLPTQTGSFADNSGAVSIYFKTDPDSRNSSIGFVTNHNGVSNTTRMLIDHNGNTGIGTVSPVAQLHTTGTVRFAGIANCAAGIVTDGEGNLSCAVSSRRFKNVVGPLSYRVALDNVMALRPEYGSYKKTPDVPEHWLIAEDVAKVAPALVGLADGKPYTVKTQNVVADLVAVVQHQQRQIDELKRVLAEKVKH
jgi:hypothetical protein